MIKTHEYWLIENKIIFKPKFNSSLDIYDNLLCKCNELIFSNYHDLQICIETSNKFFDKYDANYSGSKFNQIANLPSKIISLTFGDSFNQQVNLPSNLTHVTFGDDFNQSVNLPLNLTHMKPQNISIYTFL
jgi:hypothetical protein